MIPSHKGEFVACRRKPRRAQKIRTLEQNRFGLAGIERQGHDRGLRICGRAAAMILAHGKNPAAGKVEFEIGVAAAFRPWDPARRGAALDDTNAPIAALAEKNNAGLPTIAPAAIFVHTAADIYRRWRYIFNLAIGPAAAQNRAALLAWPCFEPVE